MTNDPVSACLRGGCHVCVCVCVCVCVGGGGMMMSFICSCRNKIETELHVYLEEVTYHTRLFRGPRTNDMKNQDGPSHSWVSSVPHGCTCVSYEEEDICVPYEEEDTCVFCLSWVSAVSARVCARLSV